MILINNRWYTTNTIEELIEIIENEVSSELASEIKKLVNKILDPEYGKVDEYLYANTLQENRHLLESNRNLINENNKINEELIGLKDKVNMLELQLEELRRLKDQRL